ncbi:MAG: DoxX family protein [Bacteroidota bacterium]
MKRNNIFYWVFTGLFSLSILAGAAMYIFKHDLATTNFTKLGFPTWIIYPLAVAKITGVIAILQRKNRTITEWAYSAFSFNLLLAAGAHLVVGDGEAGGAIFVLGLMIGSYIFSRKVAWG